MFFIDETPSIRSSNSLLTGNHDKFPTLPDGKRDVIWDYNHVDGWKQMEAVLATGKTKSIGVSNVCLGASHTAVRQPLT